MARRRSLYRRMVETFFGTKPGAWLSLNIASRIDPFLLRATKGRVGTGRLFGYPVLRLTTTGARTGLARAVALIFFHDEDRIVVVASRGGTGRHPHWYYNLKANPQAKVLLPGYSGVHTSHEASGQERERLWARACDHYAGFAAYQKRASQREIPIMVLTPQSQPRAR